MTCTGQAARVEFDRDDDTFVGRGAGIRAGAGFHAEDQWTAFRAAVDDCIETCARIWNDPQKPDSGNEMFRNSPEVRRRAAEALSAAAG